MVLAIVGIGVLGIIISSNLAYSAPESNGQPIQQLQHQVNQLQNEVDAVEQDVTFSDVFVGDLQLTLNKLGADSFFDVLFELQTTDSSLQEQIDDIKSQRCTDGKAMIGIDDFGQIICESIMPDST
jgi:hypothetical protein